MEGEGGGGGERKSSSFSGPLLLVVAHHLRERHFLQIGGLGVKRNWGGHTNNSEGKEKKRKAHWRT